MALTPEQLARLRELIDSRHRLLAEEIRQDASRSRDETHASIAGPVTDRGDDSVADLLSDLHHAELGRDLDEFREFEAARERLASGSYGKCVECGEAIEPARLFAQPAAARCVRCQNMQEKKHGSSPPPKL